MFSYLYYLWYQILYWVRRVAGLVLPVFSRPRDFPWLTKGAKWTIHIVLLVLILVGLGFLNRFLHVDVLLGRAPSWLKDYYLPLSGLLVYGLSWLGWWLWKLLWPEKEDVDFEDIATAWEEALAALRAAQIDLADAPLFLILGRPAAPEAGLFNAAQLELAVSQAPRRDDAPLHLYANRDGIYVICPGASLLGRQASLFADVKGEGTGTLEPAPGADDPFKTLGMGAAPGNVKKIQSILQKAMNEKRELTAEEKKQLRQLGGSPAPSAAVRRGPILRSTNEIELYTARFKYLCRLIARDRRPFCPINGILALVPLAAVADDEGADQVTALCARDLATARQVLQLHCPVFALVADMEKAPGFPQFLERFPEEQRQRRLGRAFPLVPDLPPEEVPTVLEGVVHWICHGLFATWIYKLFRVEEPESPDMEEPVRGNTQLYHLLGRMRASDRPLARVVSRGLATPHHGLILFGGCYVGGTGFDPVEQGFVAGVFRRLVESQNFVSWTEEGLKEEAEYDRWVRRGYTALAVFLGLVAACVVYVIVTSSGAAP